MVRTNDFSHESGYDRLQALWKPRRSWQRDSEWMTALMFRVFNYEIQIQKEQQNHLQLGIFEKSQVHETHAQTSFQAPKDLPTHP